MANKLKLARRVLAAVMMAGICALFLDPTGGTVKRYLGWMVDVQFFPSVTAGFLSAVVSSMIIALATILLTFVFGRYYCSVICPLGIMQDLFAWIGRLGGKKRKFKYSFSEEKKGLRYGVLALFVVAFALTIVPVFHLVAAILEPYSFFGRIMTTIFAPISRGVATSLAESSEAAGNFDYAMPATLNTNGAMLGIAIASLLIIAVLAFMNGRTWCNTVCPVGTILSFLSRKSVFQIQIDSDKCKHCGLCARQCKASCIDFKNMKVDTSRCVGCMDCLDSCNSNAISFGRSVKMQCETSSAESKAESVDQSKRTFLTIGAMLGGAALTDAKAKINDGGLASIIDKAKVEREEYITPPGSESHSHLETICTACGLCLTACPNDVLRPSTDLGNLLKPYMSFENGYCRPECTRCGDVCPTGAIKLVDKAKKTSIHIGHAEVNTNLCFAAQGKETCGNCEKHCPVGAISMVALASDSSKQIPNVDQTRCIGCGACEYLCPSRPISAIHVEGHRVHRCDTGEL